MDLMGRDRVRIPDQGASMRGRADRITQKGKREEERFTGSPGHECPGYVSNEKPAAELERS
jgi:hypothetical protein